MNQRRFVVEIARPVPASDVKQASAYIARRLAMDEQRIHTLLSNRTGPVTREVLADKADAIAKVFGEAGVMVTIVELPAAEEAERGHPPLEQAAGASFQGTGAGPRPSDTSAESADMSAEQAGEEPAPDYEYAGPPYISRDSPPWEELGTSQGEELAAGSDRAVAGELTDLDFPDAVDLRLSSTRWVPSPHGDDYDGDYDDDNQREVLAEDRTDLIGSVHGNGEPLTETGNDLTGDSADDLTAYFRDELNADMEMREGRQSGLEFEDRHGAAVSARQHDPGPLDLPAEFGDGADSEGDGYGGEFEGASSYDFHDDREDERRQNGLWLAPDRSPFGELGAAPRERTRLRAYLLWALVVSLLLLVVLQFVFTAGGTGAAGSSYEDGLAPYRAGEFAVARKVWEGAAGHGDPRAQYMLGYLVQNGLGQPWSNRRAAEWYQLAAAQDLPEAQTALANLYLEGLGVQPDAATGLDLLRRAADAGHAPALYQYAELLFHGRWVPQDYGAALAAFQAAAAGGSLEAADFVGLERYLESRQAAQGELAAD